MTTTTTTKKKTLANVAPGDLLIRTGRRQRTVATVTRVTPKQIIVGGHARYWKEDGFEVGHTGQWSYTTVRLPREGEVEEIRAAAEAAEIERKRRLAEEAEEKRGRMVGLMTAALAAVDRELVRLDRDDPHRRVVEKVWTVADGALQRLVDAERDVRSGADLMRRAADEYARDVDNDARHGTGTYSTLLDVPGTAAGRVAARRACEDILGLVAAVLGVTVAALVEPMAKDVDVTPMLTAANVHAVEVGDIVTDRKAERRAALAAQYRVVRAYDGDDRVWGRLCAPYAEEEDLTEAVAVKGSVVPTTGDRIALAGGVYLVTAVDRDGVRGVPAARPAVYGGGEVS